MTLANMNGSKKRGTNIVVVANVAEQITHSSRTNKSSANRNQTRLCAQRD